MTLLFEKGNDFVFEAPEFFNVYVFSSILLFAVNNFWLKFEYHNWLTGKLSDFTFCFFFPLYISAFLSLFTSWNMTNRVLLGLVITLLSFSLVKSSNDFSDLLNSVLSPMSFFIFGRDSINLVDHTDLIALIFLVPAFLILQLKRESD